MSSPGGRLLLNLHREESTRQQSSRIGARTEAGVKGIRFPAILTRDGDRGYGWRHQIPGAGFKPSGMSGRKSSAPERVKKGMGAVNFPPIISEVLRGSPVGWVNTGAGLCVQ